MTTWDRAVKPRCGYLYKIDDDAFVEIVRVASDGTWADIVIAPGGWRTRQPLRDGLLPFPAVIWSTEG